MNSAAKFVARLLIAAALSVNWSTALAGQLAGTVIKLSGPLKVKKSDGSVKFLVVGEQFEQGDTLTTDNKTYAMIRFVDNSEITLRPDTVFKVNLSAERPQRTTK